MSKRVLLVSLRSDLGGGPRHVMDLIEGFREFPDIEVFVAAPDDEPFGPEYAKLGEKYFKLGHRSFNFFLACKLLLFCRKYRIEIIHSHGRGAGFYARFLKLLGHFSVVHTFHGVHRESNFIGELKYLLDRSLIYFCDAFIFVSEDEKVKALNAGLVGAESKYFVVVNGVKIPVLRKTLDENRVPLVFSLGRDDTAKGMDIFFKYALSYLEGKSRKVKFVGAGPGLFSKKVDLDSIETVDALSKEAVNKYLSETNVYVSCSRSEGMPLAVLEALAQGCLVLLSRIPGHNYFIEAGVASGFDLGSFESFESQLDELLLRRNCFNLSGREFVQANHSISQMCSKVRAIYQKL